MTKLPNVAESCKPALSMWRTLPNRPATILGLAQVVAHAHGYTLQDIIGRDHAGKLWPVRRAVYAACRRQGFSFPAIGRRLGRDHSTIVKVLQRAQA